MRHNTERRLLQGWCPDLPDHRDVMYYEVARQLKKLPVRVDLRNNFTPAVYDQGQLGSCTAHAGAALFKYHLKAQGLHDIMPSRLKIYYDTRTIEHTIKTDAGAQLRDVMKVMAKNGVCDESLWPYVEAKFADQPPVAAVKASLQNVAIKYMRVDNTYPRQLQNALASAGPVMFGASLYTQFESDQAAKNGVIKMPKKTDKMLGGHGIAIWGYDQKAQMYIVRNSWGPDWGDKGYCYMPFDYIHSNNLCDDFWCVELVKEG